MQARLTAVQRALVLLPFVALTVAFVARPHPENRTLVGVLSEVTAFHASFRRDSAETFLRDAAETQALVPLSQAIQGAPASAKLSVLESALPIRPQVSVSVASLSDAQHFSRVESTLPISVPDVSNVGAALAWRLKHAGTTGPVKLAAIDIVPGAVRADDLALETEIPELQTAKQTAKAAVDSATKRLEAEQSLFEARRKRGLPWKVILTSIEARDAAKATLNERTASLAEIEGRYDESVQRATANREVKAFTEAPGFALARVRFENAEPALPSMDIPIRVESREVALPALSGASFAKTREAGLWDKVQGLDAAAAVLAVRDEFNWHNRYVEVAGLRIGGMTLLQVLPCLLPLLMLLVLRRLTAAAKSYSLFGTEVHNGTMPGVGFKSRLLEGLAVVLLPLLACVSAGAALGFIGEFPALPALSAAACLVLGSSLYSKLAELQILVASVVHSHSYPPPAQPRV